MGVAKKKALNKIAQLHLQLQLKKSLLVQSILFPMPPFFSI